jgi:hypothetical protein
MAQHEREEAVRAREAAANAQAGPNGGAVAIPTDARSVALRQNTLAQFADMARVLPTAEEDASMSIVAQILQATTVEELDAPWRDTDGEALIGVTFEAQSVTLHQSDYTEGLGVFLRVEGVRLDNGEVVSFSTGSVSTVAQLVRAFTLNAFPFVAEIVKADRPTKKGYFPLHLKIVAGKAATAASV